VSELPISVVIADDHPVVLMGLESLFAAEVEFRVVAKCVDGQEALRAVEEHDPDILLMDLNMPRLGGLDVLREMKGRNLRAKTVVLSASLSSGDVQAALRLGARGVILKEEAAQKLLSCLHSVHRSGYWLERTDLTDILNAAVEDAAQLTQREDEIASLIADGMRNKEIGRRLGISEGTVKAHLHNIYRKLGVDSRLSLAAHRRRDGR
jgi:DNA-binding NarL/FixJ family response regulator